MTNSALDTDRLQALRGVIRIVEHTGDADHRAQLQQRQGGGWIIQVYLPRLNGFHHRGRECVRVDLQANFERGVRANSQADAARKLRSFERLVQANGVAEESFTAERVVPKNFAP